MTIWKPWDDTPKDGPPKPVNQAYQIVGPPCPDCVHWNPQVVYRHTDEGYVADGVRLCHTPRDMESDFSCFRSRETKDDDVPF